MTWSQGGAQLSIQQRRKAARDYAKFAPHIADPVDLRAADVGNDSDPYTMPANGHMAVSSTVALDAGDIHIEVNSKTFVLPALAADQIMRLGFIERAKTIVVHNEAADPTVISLFVLDDFRRPHLVAATSDTAEDAVDDGDATAELMGSGGELTDLVCIFNDDDPDGAATDIEFQWFKDDVEIPGEVTDTYSLLTADIGSVFKCRVNYTDPDSPSEEIFSDEITCVAVNNGVSTVGISGVAISGGDIVASFNDDDADGAATDGPHYQWFRELAELDGETADTYTMLVADEGYRVRCQITYTDGQGFVEEVYTAYSGVIQNPVVNDGAGTADLSGVFTDGETLTATFNDDDPDGPATGVGYQWYRDAVTLIDGETSATYELTQDDVGHTVKCRVTYTDGQGFAETVFTEDSSSIADADSGDATASLSGTATEGNLLTATFNDDDPDGAATGITYQWIRGAATVIGGATANTYTLVNADVGTTVKCRVNYTDGGGFAGECFTPNSASVAGLDSGDATASLSGTPTEGQTLTTTFNDNDPDGAASGITYQWFRDPAGTNTSIGGATNNTYVPVNADVGFVLRCRVNYTDGQGFSESIFTANSAAIAAIDSGDATATLGGTAQEDQSLTATFNDDDPDGAASGITYQWFRDPAGTNTSIGGATASSYVLTASDVGFTLRCRVMYTDAQGFSETIYTATSDVVTPGAVSRFAIGQNPSPYILMYDESYAKFSNPASLPVELVFDCRWSPNGRYLALGLYQTPFVAVYDFDSGAPVRLSNPANLPTNNGRFVAWHPSGDFFTLGGDDTSRLETYFVNGTTVTRGNALAISNAIGGMAFNADPQSANVHRLFFGQSGVTPYYATCTYTSGSFSGPTWGSATSFTNVAGTITGVDVSPNGTWVAISHNTTPFVTRYSSPNNTLTQLSAVASPPASGGTCVKFSRDSTKLAVGCGNASEGLLIYNTSDWSKRTAPATQMNSVSGVDWSEDSTQVFGTQNGATPYFHRYRVSDMQHQSDLADMPGAVPRCVACHNMPGLP